MINRKSYDVEWDVIGKDDYIIMTSVRSVFAQNRKEAEDLVKHWFVMCDVPFLANVRCIGESSVRFTGHLYLHLEDWYPEWLRSRE